MTQGNTTWPKRRVAEPAKPSNKKRRVLLISSIFAFLLLGGVGLAYALGMFQDPRLGEIRDLRAKLRDSSISDKDKEALRQEMFQKVGELPDNLRRQAFDRRGNGWDPAARVNREKEILAMPHDQMIAEINKEIDRELARQADREKRTAADAAKQAAGGAPKNGGGKGGPGGPGGRPARTEDQRVAARHQFLTSIPPEARVAHNQYRELVQAQAATRGVTIGQRP